MSQENAMSVDPKPLTLAEFLAWEERQPTKHEYRDGAVYAMAGATDDHGQIIMNLSAIVRPSLRGGPCRAYANDMKVVAPFPASRYPDFIVTCDERDSKDKLKKKHPKLIIEVLSASTEAVDKGDKLDEYQTIAELQEYALIDSRRPYVRIYRRNGEKLETAPPTTTGPVTLESLNLTLSFADVYEDVQFEPLKATS
jgi:Uma2 family endonuclease